MELENPEIEPHTYMINNFQQHCQSNSTGKGKSTNIAGKPGYPWEKKKTSTHTSHNSPY